MLKHSHRHETADNMSGSSKLLSLDALGICASALCLVHCAVMPFIVLLLPAFGSALLKDDRTHYLLAFFVTTFCLLAIVPGYRRHSNKLVLLTMLSGLALVLFATFAVDMTFGESWEVPLITLGNLLVVGAHISNRRLLACC